MTKAYKGYSYFIDTSVLIETLKLPVNEVESRLESITPKGKRYATYYSIIEINRGCLASMLKLYNKVDELRDVSSAWVQISNSFGRTTKYVTLLNSLMMRYHKSIDHNNYQNYLAYLEIIIIDIQDRISSLIHQFIGSFANDSLGSFFLESKEDFFLHGELIKQKTNFEEFIKTNKDQIIDMSNYFKNQNKTLNKSEKLINDLVDSILTKPNITHVHKGDLVIALDCPKKHILIAHDKIFNIILSAQSKNGHYVSL